MKAGKAPLVKYFIAVLYGEAAALEPALASCGAALGPFDYQSEVFPFKVTRYYEEELGPNLKRRFFSIGKLISAGELGRLKTVTNIIEEKLSRDGKRTVNLDLGYLDFDKVVLASAKYNWQKIYSSHGFYADLTLCYRKGAFHPLEWSFPDFKLPTYYSALLEIRNRYKAQVREKAAG